MKSIRNRAWMVFVLVSALAFVFGVLPGTWVQEEGSDAIPRDGQWLVTSYAVVAVVSTLGITLTAFRRGERWAWLVLWVWPAFFLLHGVVFFPVDFVFAALAAGALLLARPRAADPA